MDKSSINKDFNNWSLQQFTYDLDCQGELLRINKTVNPQYELAAIVSKLDKNKAVLFESVKGSKFKVIANVLGTRRRISYAVKSPSEDQIDKKITMAVAKPVTPRKTTQRKWNMNSSDLSQMPIVTHFEKDRGPYITSSIVFLQNQETRSQNLSTHRL